MAKINFVKEVGIKVEFSGVISRDLTIIIHFENVCQWENLIYQKAQKGLTSILLVVRGRFLHNLHGRQ